jgi:hypothetical protein
MPFSVRASVEQFTLAHPRGTGQLKISVAVPAVAPPDAAVPVLFVADGDLLFGIAAEIARVTSALPPFSPLYVVGIGYDAEYLDFIKLRTADLSPPIGAEALKAMGTLGSAIGGERNGGADDFLTFMVDVLKPEIAKRYPPSRNGKQLLFGHSLGGLFAAHALLTRPESFSAFVISSPSLWWDGFSILQKLPSFREKLGAMAQQPRVFVDVGGKEQELPKAVPPGLGVTLEEAQAQVRACRMVDAAREFAGALEKTGVRAVRHVAFQEDDHASVAPTALVHGLRFSLGSEG